VATDRSTSGDNGSRAFRFSPSITGLAVWVSWTFCLEKLQETCICACLLVVHAQRKREDHSRTCPRRRESREKSTWIRENETKAHNFLSFSLSFSLHPRTLSLCRQVLYSRITRTHTRSRVRFRSVLTSTTHPRKHPPSGVFFTGCILRFFESAWFRAHLWSSCGRWALAFQSRRRKVQHTAAHGTPRAGQVSVLRTVPVFSFRNAAHCAPRAWKFVHGCVWAF